MLKIIATQLVIFAVLLLSISQPLTAQTQAAAPEPGPVAKLSPQPTPAFKDVLSQYDKKYRDQADTVDVKALEKIDRQAPKRPGSSGHTKLWVTLLVIGFTALVVVAIKYRRSCKTTDPAGCDLYNDDACTCKEYNPRH